VADRPPRLTDAPVSSPPEAETLPPRDEPSAVAGGAAPPAPPSGGFEVAHAELPAPFGRYRLEKVLGKGGMGAVYLAYDTQLDRRVALKVPTFGSDEDAPRERFFREARAAATLRHPNLCPVFDIGEHSGVSYLTMAYIEGTSLADYLHAHKPLPPREAAGLVRVLARALQEAHDHGIIHRDLKPSNVLLSAKKEPVVTDFGLARRSASQDERLTQTGAILGTPAYMPPEQVNGDVAAMGPGCDIYSLGIILYELLAGRPPFEGPMGTLIAQIVLDPPPPLTRFRPELDPDLEAVCLKALAKRPRDRYPSMAAFAEALEAWLAGKGSTPARRAKNRRPTLAERLRDIADEPKTLPAKPRSKKSRVFWLTLTCTAVLVLCVLPVGWVVVMLTKLVDKVSDNMTQAAGRYKEQRQEQDRQRRERDKEQQELEKLARTWRPPPAGVAVARLFPARVGDYRLEGHDTKADIPALGLKAPGRRAAYQGPAGAMELFAYRAKELQKEAIFHRALEAVTRRGVPGLGPGSPSVVGSALGMYLSFDLGSGAAGTGQFGTFWWHRDWLFLARGGSPKEPGPFLKAYLTKVGRRP
jgi:predicted Ser/Thr protein kinase